MDTIFILNKSMSVVDMLSNNGDSPQSPFFDDKYIQEMNTGAETFEFTTISNARTNKYLVAGNYVAFKFNNKVKVFQILETEEEHQDILYKHCYCEIAGLELINDVVRAREIASANIRQFMEIALGDTSWKLGIVDAAINSVHTIKIDKPTNVYGLIQNNLNKYDIEIEYRFVMRHNRIIGKYIDVYRQRGKQTRKRFEYGVNVAGVSKKVDMSELVTALIGTGKNNIDFKSVEGVYPIIKPLNQDFVADDEAYKIWNNNGSHIVGVFKADTESPHELLKLTWNELQRRKQPKFTYDIDTEMLQGDEDEICIGDTVYVIDNDYAPALHLSARVGKLEISFTDYTKNKCILTNFKDVKSGILSLETIQAIVDGKFPVTSENIADGAIIEGKIDSAYLYTIKTDILLAGKVQTEELIADKADIKDLTAINGEIENLKGKDAEFTGKVTSAEAEIGSLKSKNASIEHLLAGNITSENIQAGSITSKELATGTITAGSGVIADGAIGNAQISELDASKINAGTIDTSKVTVAGTNSNLKISGNKLQVFDGIGANQVERVSLGDINGDGSKYGFLVRGADGQTIIMDENGVTNAGITDGSITNDKINPDANIDGAKLNINSVINKINTDGSESIQGTKIEIDGTNLSTKLSSITTSQTEDRNKISQNTANIKANENSIKLKVDEQVYQSDKSDMNSKLNKNTAAIDVLKNEIALKIEQTDINKAVNEIENTVDTKINTAKSEIKATTDAISQRVSSTESNTTTLTNKVNQVDGKINTAKNQAIDASREILDTRNDNRNPKWYIDNYGRKRIEEFKNSDVVGISGSRVYGTVTTNVPWADRSGGYPTQIFRSNEKATYERHGISDNAWSSWKQVEDTEGSQNKATAALNSAKSYTNTEITKTNNKVSSIETDLSGITSKVSNIESTQTSTNNKVSSLETRVSTAESKITKSAITNVVKESFYTKDDINSKGYQTSSQVQQKVDSLQAKFEESGGYNLLRNTAFKNGTEYWHPLRWDSQAGGTNNMAVRQIGDYWTLINRNSLDANVTGLTSSAAGKNLGTGFDSDKIPARSNTVYTFSGLCAGHRVKKIFIEMQHFNSSNGFLGNKTALITTIKSGGKDRANWHKFNHTFTTFENTSYISVRMFMGEWTGESDSAYMWLAEPLLVEGNNELLWTPCPDEVYTGITSIDKDGITVRNSNSDTYTQIDASSFSVNDNNGGTVAEFARNSNIPNLTSGTINAENVYANNVASKSTIENTTVWTTYYVQGNYGSDNNPGNGWGANQAFKTIEKALSLIPTVINQNYMIKIGGSVTGARVVGKSGSGILEIHLEDDAVVSGAIDCMGCSCMLQIFGNESKKGTLKQGATFNNCTAFDIGWISFRGQNWSTDYSCNVFAFNHSKGIVRCCDFNGDISYAVIVGFNTHIWCFDNRGSALNNYIGLKAYSTVSMMKWGEDNYPDFRDNAFGNAGHARMYAIINEGSANYVKVPSVGWNPSYTPTQRISTWNFNSVWSDETLNGWGNKNELIQGYYSGWNTGRWTGYMQMSDGFASIRNTISGGTNLSGRIYIQRRTSSGNSIGSKLCLYGSDGTLITNSTSIDRGQGVWVFLSSSVIQKIQSGAIKYFYLRADSNNASTYFKCESNAKIEITYTK